MALLLSDGTYLKVELSGARIFSNDFSYNLYASAADRETEKTTGSLPPFHKMKGDHAVCPSYDLTIPLAGIKPASDELATLIYQALKADIFPEAIDA